MSKKKSGGTAAAPTNPANLSQNMGDKKRIPVGSKNGNGQGAGNNPK